MAKNSNSSVRPFGMRDKVGYMFGDFGNDFTFILSSSFMLKFYTDVMGVSAGVVGILMMAARFVDAVTDVTMGQIVDRSKPTKDGKFKPWIRRMCGPVAIASFLIYQSGFADMAYGFKVAWMAITYLLWGSIFYTSINIPYGSMASAVSADPKDRADLSTWRTIGATLAGLVIGVGTPMFAYEVVDGNTVLSGTRMTIIAGVFGYLLPALLQSGNRTCRSSCERSETGCGQDVKERFNQQISAWYHRSSDPSAVRYAGYAGYGRFRIPQLLWFRSCTVCICYVW